MLRRRSWYTHQLQEKHVQVEAIHHVSIFLDQSALEIFINSGEFVMSLRYFSKDDNKQHHTTKQTQIRLLQIWIRQRIAAVPDDLTRNRIRHQAMRNEIVRNCQPFRFGNRRQITNDKFISSRDADFFNPEVVRNTVRILRIDVRPLNRRGSEARRSVVRGRDLLIPADRITNAVIRGAAQRAAQSQRNRRTVQQERPIRPNLGTGLRRLRRLEVVLNRYRVAVGIAGFLNVSPKFSRGILFNNSVVVLVPEFKIAVRQPGPLIAPCLRGR